MEAVRTAKSMAYWRTGATYVELGATWSDAVDGSGTVTAITGSVNTATVGSYTLTYRKTDAAGNTGTATRAVTVNAAPDSMPIYLDGY